MSFASNPYAAPSPPALPAPPTPDGVQRFRLDPEKQLTIARRRLRVVGTWSVALVALFVLPTALASPSTAILALVPLAAFFLFVSRGARVKLADERATYDLVVTSRVLRRCVAGSIPAEILAPEVTRIAEMSEGLMLLCDAPRRALFVTRALDGYDDVRAIVSSWRPIEQVTGADARGVKKWVEHEAQRDAVAGTALATDPSLREELAVARSASSAAHLGFPVSGARVAGRRSLVWALALWALLILMFIAIWQFLSPAPSREHGARRARPTPTE